jgi:pimeloyl-ACP methyl ester carboxylesterase
MRLPIFLLLSALLISCDGVSIAPLPLAPCHVDGLSEEIRCGVREVFEDRDHNRGRRLSIHVAVLPALRRIVEADPLFLFAGGPGQGARELAPAAARFFRAVRRHRDIVLVDLRGTGASSPLKCAVPDDDLGLLQADDFAAQAEQCAAELPADPRFFTHHQSLADVDDIRRDLGYDRINVWGGSWGTRAALLYALRYPDSTRTVILDGAAPLTLAFPSTVSADAQAALDLLIDNCREDAVCRTAFPDPRADIAALERRFVDDLVTVSIRHPRTHQQATVTLDRGIVFDMIRGALYGPRDAAAALALIRDAANGDFAPIVAQHFRTSSMTTDSMTLGATFAVLCSEDLPAMRGRDFRRDAGGSRFGTAYADIWRSRCRDWPAGQPLAEPAEAISQAPALILSGAHDPVTPPRTGEMMARHFARVRHVVVTGAAHNTSFTGCVPDLIADFIARGHGDAIDPACAGETAWPPFVIDAAGTRP